MKTIETITLVGVLLTFIGVMINGLITWRIARIQRFDKYNQVALEKRLEVYQKAYQLSYEMYIIFEEDSISLSQKLHKFWRENALYLDSTIREEFLRVEFTEQVLPNTQKAIVEGLGLPWLDEEKKLTKRLK